MKSMKIIITTGIISVLSLLFIDSNPIPNRYSGTKPHIHRPEAWEGSREDRLAQPRLGRLVFHGGLTNRMPRNIRTKEAAFVNKLAKQMNPAHRPVAQEWEHRGPYRVGGRTKALALDVLDENIIIAGGVSGGMWKSTDGGSSWFKTTAHDQIHSVSCIAQNKSPGNEHIWYYGTGEWGSFGRGGSASGPGGTGAFYRGDGIFKSTDCGNTWSQLASTVSGTANETDPFDFIWKIVTFGDHGVYAATSQGLFMSIDGGETWNHDLDFGNNEPINTYPSTEIAVTGQGICYATIGGEGPDNGLYRSIDGESWVKFSPPDWPDTTKRTVIGISPSNENVVYFFTEIGLWKQQLRKYEEGVGWTNLTEYLPFNAEMTTYGGNMLIIHVKPDDENTIFLGTVDLFRSTDGGQSFEVISACEDFHVDQHAIVFLPSDPKVMIVGNDGGLFKTNDNTAEVMYNTSSGTSHIDWESLNNGYLTTQFYTVTVDHGTSGSVMISGGMQDNGCMFTASSNPQGEWEELIWGDGGSTAISDGGDYHYTALAAMFRLDRHTYDNGTHLITNITPASARMGLWLTIFMLDPMDQKIMYLPCQTVLWRNSDLTSIPAGTTPTDINWSQLENVTDYYIHSLGMSRAEPRRLYYAGSWIGGFFYDERVFYIDNPHEGQPQPVEVTGENFPFYPDCPAIHCIAVDPRDSRKVIVVFPDYGILSIYASDNGGDSWDPVSGNLEEYSDGSGCGPSVRWVSILYVEDQPVYFAGTSVGLFSTTKLDGMNTIWIQEGASTIGNVVVDMIDVRQSDGFVVVGTHGNGVYSTVVTELPSGIDDAATHPYRFRLLPSYPNPFNHATTIQFTLPEAGKVRLKAYNVLGEEVAAIMDKTLPEGEHEVRWAADGLSSGTYIVRIDFKNHTDTEKVVFLK